MLSIDTQNISDGFRAYKPSGKSEILTHQFVVDLGPGVIKNIKFFQNFPLQVPYFQAPYLHVNYFISS